MGGLGSVCHAPICAVMGGSSGLFPIDAALVDSYNGEMVSTPTEPEFCDSDDESVDPGGLAAFVAASLSEESTKRVTDTSRNGSQAEGSNEGWISGATIVWASILGLAIVVGSAVPLSDTTLLPLAVLLIPVSIVGLVVSLMRTMIRRPERPEPTDRTVTQALGMMESEGLTWDEAWLAARTRLDQPSHED
jgi:hypothetical protein